MDHTKVETYLNKVRAFLTDHTNYTRYESEMRAELDYRKPEYISESHLFPVEDALYKSSNADFIASAQELSKAINLLQAAALAAVVAAEKHAPLLVRYQKHEEHLKFLCAQVVAEKKAKEVENKRLADEKKAAEEAAKPASVETEQPKQIRYTDYINKQQLTLAGKYMPELSEAKPGTFGKIVMLFPDRKSEVAQAISQAREELESAE